MHTDPDHTVHPLYDDGSIVLTNGLTKREYFAAAALQGLLADPDTTEQLSTADVVEVAVHAADALIEALNEDGI